MLKIVMFKRKTLLTRRWQHYFRIVARNGRIVAVSEGYNNVGDMMQTIALLRAGIPTAKLEQEP